MVYLGMELDILTCKFSNNRFSYGLRCSCHHAYEAILNHKDVSTVTKSFNQRNSLRLTSFPSGRYGEKCSESNCVSALPFVSVIMLDQTTSSSKFNRGTCKAALVTGKSKAGPMVVFWFN